MKAVVVSSVGLILIIWAGGTRACETDSRAQAAVVAPTFAYKCNSSLDPSANEEIVAGKIYRVRSRAANNWTGATPPLDTPIYVIRSETRHVVIFSLGYGNRSVLFNPSDMATYTTPPYSALVSPVPVRLDALKSSQVDAANLQRVIESKECLNMPKWGGSSTLAPVTLDFVVPHAHADHVNSDLLTEVAKLGGKLNRLIYHGDDHAALHCTSPWCGVWNSSMSPDLKKKAPYNLFAFAPFSASLVNVAASQKVMLSDPQDGLKNHCATPLLQLPYDDIPGGIQFFRSSDPGQAQEDGVAWSRDYAFDGGDVNVPFHTPGSLTLYLPRETAFDGLDLCQGFPCKGLALLGADPKEQNCFWPARDFRDGSGEVTTRRRGSNNGDVSKAPYARARALGQHILIDDTLIK